MTQPESRTVEEVFAETIWDALSDHGVLRIHADSPKELVDITASILAAAKEHGLIIGEGELDVERLTATLYSGGWFRATDIDLDSREMAEAIAAEYERLRR